MKRLFLANFNFDLIFQTKPPSLSFVLAVFQLEVLPYLGKMNRDIDVTDVTPNLTLQFTPDVSDSVISQLKENIENGRVRIIVQDTETFETKIRRHLLYGFFCIGFTIMQNGM